jgi:hypothetical protein
MPKGDAELAVESTAVPSAVGVGSVGVGSRQMKQATNS